MAALLAVITPCCGFPKSRSSALQKQTCNEGPLLSWKPNLRPKEEPLQGSNVQRPLAGIPGPAGGAFFFDIGVCCAQWFLRLPPRMMHRRQGALGKIRFTDDSYYV